MATVLLVRHGRSSANNSGVLAGRGEGVLLDEAGQEQASQTGIRIAALPLVELVSSPLERCRQTAESVAAARTKPLDIQTDERLTECGYGDWTGRQLKLLAKEPLWKVVQGHPSAATFPGGESLRNMQSRAVSAVRDWDERVTAEHGPNSLWVAVSHGDVIKAILADALGTHLDNFQRIVVDPASVSVITYTPLRPFVVRYNEHGDLSGLAPKRKSRTRRRAASSDAAVGGGAGA
ncbi:MAG: MSMEG_4193 family putative phosphomutase [Nocardioidaceae bacterium]|nr:MSMEG_4193 family putative phosphomutase [Nocardioidaceae bacterium]